MVFKKQTSPFSRDRVKDKKNLSWAGNLTQQLTPKWKGPLSVMLATSTSVKVAETAIQVHLSRIKLSPLEPSQAKDHPKGKSYSY